jgi:hypothetical protein
MKSWFRNKLIIILVVLAVIFSIPVACGSNASRSSEPASGGQAQSGPVYAPAPSDGKGVSGTTGGPPAVSAERRIIRNGNISLTVSDVNKGRDGVGELATRLGGYVVSSSFSGKDEELKGSIAIRVPDDKFEQALSELRKMAVKVESESSYSQDVTEEYIDLSARLKNAEATETQYLVLLAKAVTVEDILKVQERLSQVRSEIEQIKGRLQYLERQTDMSLITVFLSLDAGDYSITILNWNPVVELKTAAQGLITLLTLTGTLAIWLIVFSPFWGGIIALVYFIRRLRRRKVKTL